jgi:hypothetical protein
MSWVAREIPPEQRDPELTFSHYRALAALGQEKREEWKEKLLEQPMSVGELRGRLRAKQELNTMVYVDQKMLGELKELARFAPINEQDHFKRRWSEEL